MSNQAFYYINGEPLNGAWIDLDAINSTDEVLEALADLNIIDRDEEGEPDYNGDLLVADAEGLASPFLDSHGCFDLDAFVDCRDHDADNEAKAAYCEFADWDGDDFDETYSGQYDSDEDFAYNTADQLGLIDSSAQWPNNCIDWERAARDLMHDYFESNGYYFRSI